MKHYTRIQDIRQDLEAGLINCAQLVEHYLEREQANRHLNAFVEVWADEARARAAEVDAKVQAGTAGRLAGAVIALKDNLSY